MPENEDLDNIRAMKTVLLKMFREVEDKPAAFYHNGYGEGAGTSYGAIAAQLAQGYATLLAEERAQMRQPVRLAPSSGPRRDLP